MIPNATHSNATPRVVSPRGERLTTQSIPIPEYPDAAPAIHSFLDEKERQELVERGTLLLQKLPDPGCMDPNHYAFMDDNLFAHIHGNTKADAPELQGIAFKRTIGHLLYFLERFIPFKAITDVIALLRSGLDCSEKMSQAYVYDENLAISLAENMTSHVLKLKPGEKLFCPGGYCNYPGGHALAYVWIAQPDGTLTFELGNTGEGLQYHLPAGVKGQLKFYPMKRLEKISKDEALLVDFFRAAFEYQLPKELTIEKDECRIEDIYSKLLPMLKGVEVQVESSEHDIITAQNMGNCAERVLHLLIRRHCLLSGQGIQAYKEFKHQFKRITLLHYYAVKEKNNELGKDTPRILLENALMQFARSLEKRIAQRGVKDEELVDDLAIIEAIKSKLKAVKESQKADNVADPTFQDEAGVRDIEFEDVWIDPPAAASTQAKMTSDPSRPALDTFNIDTSMAYMQYCLEENTNGSLQEAIHYFNDVLARLPLTENVDVEKLEQFSAQSYQAIATLAARTEKFITPISLLYHFKAFKIMFLRAKERPENKLKGFNESFPIQMRFSPYFVFGNPLHEKNLRELCDFDLKNYKDVHPYLGRIYYDLNLTLGAEYFKQFYEGSETLGDDINYKHLANIYSDLGDKQLLPVQVVALRKQLLRYDLLEETSVDTKNIKKLPFFQKFIYKIEKVANEYRIHAFGVSQDKHQQRVPVLDHTPIFKYNFPSLAKDQHTMLEIVRQNTDVYYWAKREDIKHPKVTPPIFENDVVKMEPVDAFTFEESRNFRTLNVNRGDAPYNALADFTKYLPKLADPANQEYFFIQFFKVFKLENYLKKHPAYIHVIADFITRGIAFFEPLENWQACAFFAQLTHCIAHNQPHLFPNRREKLWKWFSQTRDASTKQLMALHLLHSFETQPPKTDKEIEDFITAYVYVKSNPIPQQVSPIFLDEVSAVIHRHKPLFGTLSAAQKNNLGNRLLATVLNTPRTLTWTADFRATDANIHYEIDLDAGAILINKVHSRGLPDKLYTDPLFDKLFKNKVFAPEGLGPNYYQFKDQPHIPEANVRVFLNLDSAVRVEQKAQDFDSESFAMGAEHSQMVKAAPIASDYGSKDCVFLPTPTAESRLKEKTWVIQRRIDGEWLQHIENEKLDLPYELKQTHLQYWINSTHNECIVTDMHFKKCYGITFDFQLLKKIIVKIVKFRDQESPLELVLFKGYSTLIKSLKDLVTNKELISNNIKSLKRIVGINDTSLYQFLTHFEQWNDISIWKEQVTDKVITKGYLEFPRYGLQFEIRDGKAWSKDLPDFFLVSPKKWNGLAQEDRYLVLENKEGDRRVCLPRLKQSTLKLKGGEPLKERFATVTDAVRVFTYEVNKKGLLQPKTVEQNLYLAYLYLCKGRSQETIKTALRFVLRSPGTKRLTPEEKELCGWILSSESAAFNKDPELNTLRLKLFCLCQQNRIAFDLKNIAPGQKAPDEIIEPEHLQEIYSYYIKNRTHSHALTLQPHEEELIRRIIGKPCDFLHNQLSVKEGGAVSNQIDSPPSSNLQRAPWTEEHLKRFLRDVKVEQAGMWLPPEEARRISFTYPSNKFLGGFNAFFTIIKSGDTVAIESLRRRLTVMKIHPEGLSVHIMRDFLLFLLDHPDQCKTLPLLSNSILTLEPFFESLLNVYTPHVYPQTKPNTLQSKVQTFPIPVPDLHERLVKRSYEQKAPARSQNPILLMPCPNLVDKLQDDLQAIKVDDPMYALRAFRLRTNFKQAHVNKFMEECNDELKAYFDTVEATKAKLSIKNPGELRAKLKQLVDDNTPDLRRKKHELLKLANKLSFNPIERLLGRLGIHSFTSKELTLKELLSLYITGNQIEIIKRNPNLTPSQVDQLMQQLTDYFELANVHKQRKRCIEKIDKLIAAKSPAHIDALTEEAIDQLTAQRHYDASMPSDRVRAFQVFEYLCDTRIRSKQIRIINNILDGKSGDEEREFVAQLIMGGGKSKVILPLLALLMADGKNLALLLVPKALLDMQRQYMTEISGGLFNQDANSFDFDINTLFTNQQLKDIRDRLERILRQKEYAIVTPETMQAIEVRYVECRKKLKNAKVSDAELQEMTLVLGEILSLLRERSKVIMDEADTILYNRNELHFTSGEGKPIDDVQRKFVQSLYSLLAQDPDMVKLLQLRNNKQVSHWKKNHTKIKEAIVTYYEKQFCRSDADKVLFKQYVLGDKTLNVKPSFITQLSQEQQDLIVILKGELCTLLDVTLQREGHRDYTFSETNPSIVYAIPAKRSRPVEGSEFGHHFEAINYAFQLILQRGVTETVAKTIVNSLRQQALQEIKRKPLQQTKSYVTFSSLCPHLSLFSSDPNLIKEVMASVNSSVAMQLKFADLYVTSAIRLYPTKTSSDSIRLIHMFKSVFGVTGTPWNFRTFQKRLAHVALDKGTDGYTLALMLLKAKQAASIFYLEPINLDGCNDQQAADAVVKAVLKSTEALTGARKRSFIDCGAIFKGLEPMSLARAFLEQLKPTGVKGVVFFMDNKLRCLEEGSVDPIPLETSRLKPENWAVFFDESHCIGSDVKQKRDVIGTVTHSENLLLKDPLQAIWRMREVDKEQTPIYLFPTECRESINVLLGKDPANDLEPEDILTYPAINQAITLGEDIVRSWKLMIVGVMWNQVVTHVLKVEKEDPILAQEIFDACDIENLFTSTQENKPAEQFGQIETLRASALVLDEFKQDWLKRFDKALNTKLRDDAVPVELKSHLKTIHDAVHQDIDDLGFPDPERIPIELPEPQHDRLGTQIQIQNAVATEVKQNIQLENKVSLAINKPQETNAVWDWAPDFKFDELLSDPKNAKSIKSSPEESDCPYFKLSEAFSQESDLSTMALELENLEKENVHVYFSNNYFNIWPEKASEPHFSWYDQHQKPMNHLFMHLEKDGRLSVMLISEDDLVQWQNKLDQLPENCWIFDLRQSQLHHYSEQNIFSTIQGTERFKKVIVLLKLINGETHYPDEDKEYLENIVKRHHPLEFRAAMSVITAHKDTRLQFEGSVLEEVMLKSRGPEAQVGQLLQTEKDREAMQELHRKKIEQVRAQKDEALRLQKAEQERLQKEGEEYLRREEEERTLLANKSQKPEISLQSTALPDMPKIPKAISFAKPKPSLWFRVATIARNIIAYLVKCVRYYKDQVIKTCSRIRASRIFSTQSRPLRRSMQ